VSCMDKIIFDAIEESFAPFARLLR
jgi:hypothetical protein